MYLRSKYVYQQGNAALGIDFPELNVDVKVTRVTQPQSSCPFKSARQKVYGLGYSLLVFVYDKMDDPIARTGRLKILLASFIQQHRTGDYQTTSGILKLVENNANVDDIVAFLMDRYLPLDEVQAYQLAEEILRQPPELGYLTISNALQWRLQYSRVMQVAGQVEGVMKLL
jgi:hypothetical protein